MHLLSPTEARRWSDSQCLDLLFEPGFSTVSEANELSGRGIGLDVVRSQLKALQGSITVRSVPQQGATFSLRIPLSLTVKPTDAPAPIEWTPTEQPPFSASDMSPVDVPPPPSLEEIWGGEHPAGIEPALPASELPLMASASASPPFLAELALRTAQLFIWIADSRVYVLPYSCIEEHLTPKIDQIIQSQNQRFLQWREHLIQLYLLSELLANDTLSPAPVGISASPKPMLTLIIRHQQQVIALESTITRLMVDSELMVQPPSAIASSGYLYGYTRLENEAQVPVIDVMALLNQMTGDQPPTISSTRPLLDLPNSTSIENSATTTLESAIAGNPEVVWAFDGEFSDHNSDAPNNRRPRDCSDN